MPINDPTAALIKRLCMLVIEPILHATVAVLGHQVTGNTVREVRERLGTAPPTKAMNATAFMANAKFAEGVPDSELIITPLVVQAIYEAIEDVLGGEVNLNGIAECLGRSRLLAQKIANSAAELYDGYPPVHRDRMLEAHHDDTPDLHDHCGCGQYPCSHMDDD